MGIKPNDQTLISSLTAAWARMYDSIAHDITTPLVIASMGGDAVAKALPELIAGYRLAVAHNLIKPDMGEKHLKLVEEHSIPSISSNVEWVLDFFKSAYDYKQQMLVEPEKISHHQINACVRDIIEGYPFPDEKTRASVKIQCNDDFTFRYPSAFVAPLFTNLLRNALAAIARAGKGDITIWTAEEGDYNVIHFKDTGSGMDEGKTKRIFDRFFSKSEDTVAPGLGLCRLAALYGGGDILCSSEKELYTDFTVKFAKYIE